MSAIEPNWPSLLVFLPAWLLGCAGLLYLSGSLPPAAAPVAVRAGFGPALVWLNLAVFVLLCILTLGFALKELRWTTLIIASGVVVLFAPFAVQDLPASLKDTQRGHALLLCLGVLALLFIAMSF
jgi:hypothetical protein